MTQMSPREILDAVRDGLDMEARWRRLLEALGYDPDQGRPGLPLLNDALERRGFRRVLKADEAMRPFLEPPYPDEWWYEIAEEITGRRDARTDEVLAKLTKAAPARFDA
jgi:hypothetical protein